MPEHRFLRPLGFLSMLASLPILEAGVKAALAFFGEGKPGFALTSTLGALAASLLLFGGVLLCCRIAFGRKVVYTAAWLSIPVHIFGTLIRLMGGHAILYGVCYPIAIMVLLHRATPSGGISGRADPSSASARHSKTGGHLMAGLA